MGYDIDFQKEDNLGIIRLNGEIYKQDSMFIWQKILHALLAEKLHSVLIFDNTIKHLSYSEVIEIVQWFEYVGFPKTRKIAIVEPESIPDINLFGKDVSSIKGWNNINIFRNEEIARKWLSEPI
jgi:hypothetical protein